MGHLQTASCKFGSQFTLDLISFTFKSERKREERKKQREGGERRNKKRKYKRRKKKRG